MARNQSAAEKVFGIAKLLEQILLVAAYGTVESSWSIRETLEPVAFLSRIQMVNRSSRAIIIGSSKLQHILQDPVDLLSSCPYCGSDKKHPHPNKSHIRWTCPLSRHYEPIIWLLKYQLHNNVTGYQDDLQDLYTKGLWFQKDALGIEREEYARRSVEEVPYEFSRYKSMKAASWRAVKVPKTRVVIESPPPRNREHYNHGGWEYKRYDEWKFAEEATLGDVYEKYVETIASETRKTEPEESEWEEDYDVWLMGDDGCYF